MLVQSPAARAPALGMTVAALVLGLLSLIGPASIDMYLPALPRIADDLGASTAAVQSTLMAYFIAFGLFQIVYGPVSDALGRRAPLVFGLVLFAAASFGCFLAPNIDALIACRAVQGIGAAAVMVTPRAIIRDLHTGPKAARLMALVMLVISVSPMFAPLLGSLMIVPFGWRSVFLGTVGIAALGLALTLFVLPETHPKEARIPPRLSRLLPAYARLLRDPFFMGLTLIGGLGMGSFFAFLASSSFLYIDTYGLSPTAFSLAFAFNAIGFFAMSQLAGWVTARYGMVETVRGAVLAYAGCAVVLMGSVLAGFDGFFVLAGLLFVTYACLGLVIPTAMVLSLEENGAVAGMASALGGTVQMLCGAGVMGVASVLFDGSALPMATIIALCGVGSLVLAKLTLRRPALPV